MSSEHKHLTLILTTTVLPAIIGHIVPDMTYNVFSGTLNSTQLECGPLPNLMVALPNIGGALCSTPQFG